MDLSIARTAEPLPAPIDESVEDVAPAEPLTWDQLWKRATFPAGDRDQWRALMAYRTAHPADAEMLAAYEWTPADVLAARKDPYSFWPDINAHSSPRPGGHRADDGDEGWRRASLMALAEETARFHASQAALARDIRTQYMLDLTQRVPEKQRWSHERIGLVVGLTEQRVQQILRKATMGHGDVESARSAP